MRATVTAPVTTMAASARTCIGCRQVVARAELVRLVVVEGRLRAGPRRGQFGRGASIHPREACVKTAVKIRAFARAFRMPGLEPIGDDAVQAFVKDIEEGAHLSQRLGNG